MTDEQKITRIDHAMDVLGSEIAADKSLGLETTLNAMSALLAFTRNAPAQSKVRLFDILTSKEN